MTQITTVTLLLLGLLTTGCKKKSDGVPYMHKGKDGAGVVNTNCVMVGDTSAYCVDGDKYMLCDTEHCLELPTTTCNPQ